MSEFFTIVKDNSEWVFGSTSLAAFVLGCLQIFMRRNSKKASNHSETEPDRASSPKHLILTGSLAALICAAIASGYLVFTGGDANTVSAGDGASQTQDSNVITSGNDSQNVISNDSTVIISD